MRLVKGGFVRHINPHYCYYYYYPGKQSRKYSSLYGLYKWTFFFHIGIPLPYLTAHNWQKWKRVFLTCLCHKIYRDEAVGLKSCKYTWKITILVKMWNLGQNRENLIFCQYLLNWSSNLKILLPMFDKYNCDYLKHSTFRFNLIDIQLNTDFPSQFCVTQRSVSQENAYNKR